MSNKKVWSALPTEELSRNILGGADIPVLFHKSSPADSPEKQLQV